MKKNKKKIKTVYLEDKGQTIYSMASLSGKTPEEQEELEKKRKQMPDVTAKERLAMISAAFTVYGPMLLIAIGGFTITALVLYLLMK